MIEETAVIRQVQQGDHEAFSQLVMAYEKQVYNLCLRMTDSVEDAEDLAQEAFVKAWRGLQFYKAEAKFSTWLFRLTTNVCIDHLRQKKRKPSVSMTMEEEENDRELEIPDPAPTPEQKLLDKQQQAAVSQAMSQLEVEFREILTLRVVDDLPYEQIAEILDIKIGTVKSRLARARWKLKKILLEQGNILEAVSSKEAGKGVDVP